VGFLNSSILLILYTYFHPVNIFFVSTANSKKWRITIHIRKPLRGIVCGRYIPAPRGAARGNSGAHNCLWQLCADNPAVANLFLQNCVVCHQEQRVTRCARLYHYRLSPPRLQPAVTHAGLEPGPQNRVAILRACVYGPGQPLGGARDWRDAQQPRRGAPGPER
jgi:hypothetical protein